MAGNTIAECVKGFLELNRIDPKRLAERAGMPAELLEKILNRKRIFTTEAYKDICDALNVRFDFFIKTVQLTADNVWLG